MNPAWEECFEWGPVPRWLSSFAENPDKAVDALLWRRFYHGHLQAAEPEDLLTEWAQLLGGDFLDQLDDALALWVDQTWGTFPESRSAAALADAWSTVVRTATYTAGLGADSRGLQRTGRTLRRCFGDAGAYLGPLSTGPSRDPFGRYLGAVASYQEDRSLAAFWWHLCDLPDSVPFYRARHAIEGLEGLPPRPGEDPGSFPTDVVRGLVRLAHGFEGQVRRGLLSSNRARREFLAIGRLSRAAFPFPERWRETLSQVLPGEEEAAASWLTELVPGVTSGRVSGPSLDWADRATQIARDLKGRAAASLSAAEALLQEQRQYAHQTGESYFLARSLCNFASSIRAPQPECAVAWAEEAMLWEPWNAYSWTTLTVALAANGRLADALQVAWQAVERFPENVVARSSLADALKAQGRLRDAELACRDTLEQFPDDVVTRAGLANILEAQGQLQDAERSYRVTLEQSPENAVVRNSLAHVLKAQGRLRDAELAYRGTLEQFPDDAVAGTGLANVLRAQGRLREASEEFRAVLEKHPRDPYARDGLERALREIGDSAVTATQDREGGDIEGDGRVIPRKLGVVPTPATEPRPGEPHERLAEESEAAEASKAAGTPPARREEIVGEARMLRRWAYREQVKEGGATASVEDLRRRASALLEEAIRHHPGDPRPLAEKALLLIDEGRGGEARELLCHSLPHLPSALDLKAARARAERDRASREALRLDSDGAEEVVGAARTLGHLSQACRPLALLQEGRAYLALQDGQARADQATGAFRRLDDWIGQHQAGEGFTAWWAEKVRRYALDPVPPDRAPEPGDLPAIEAWQRSHAVELDRFEEDFSSRLTLQDRTPTLPGRAPFP